jgi:hypothetical protein
MGSGTGCRSVVNHSCFKMWPKLWHTSSDCFCCRKYYLQVVPVVQVVLVVWHNLCHILKQPLLQASMKHSV